jgi:hypothetical protein
MIVAGSAVYKAANMLGVVEAMRAAVCQSLFPPTLAGFYLLYFMFSSPLGGPRGGDRLCAPPQAAMRRFHCDIDHV